MIRFCDIITQADDNVLLALFGDSWSICFPLYMTKQENFDIVYKCEKSDCEELRNGYIDCYVYQDFSRKSFNPAQGEKEKWISFFVLYVYFDFSMGVMLGKKDHFFEELSSLGLTSFLFPYTDRAFYRIGLLADKSFYEER